LFNRELHAKGICPGNHTVDYASGWFYYDAMILRRPALTAEADRLMKAKTHIILYCGDFNTHVIHERLEEPHLED
jgi:hypothetical protein